MFAIGVCRGIVLLREGIKGVSGRLCATRVVKSQRILAPVDIRVGSFGINPTLLHVSHDIMLLSICDGARLLGGRSNLMDSACCYTGRTLYDNRT